METTLSFSTLRAATSRGRFFPLQHEELTVFAVNTAPMPWISGELELFQRFFFFSFFATFAGLEFPLKPQHPRLFSSCSDVPFLWYRKTTFVCSWRDTWDRWVEQSRFFFGHCSPAQGKSGRKKFLFQVEKQGVSSWSDLSSCWLLSEAKKKNASHLDISRCRRKFLRQQLLKCAILTFFILFLIFIFILETQKRSCRWSRRAGIWNFLEGFCFVFFFMFGVCSGKFL